MNTSDVRRDIAAVMVGFAIVPAACGQASPTDAPTAEPRSTASTPGATGGPPPCLDAKLVWADALERLLLTNCVDQTDLGSLETVWAWDGSAWELLSDDGPPATVVTGMAWDPDRDVLVRYGGIPLPSQECITETWEWDMTEWRHVDAEPPEPCDHLELAWDASVQQVLLVGGGREQDLMPGTWAWDGTAWTLLTDGGPAPRAHHGFATDESGALVHGGLDTGRVHDDLWAWDRSAWEEVMVDGEGPGPRSHHGFAIGADGVLLFGGATSTSTFSSLVDETWLLADGAWSLLSGPGPSARGLPALGFDFDREVYLLHAGFDTDGAQLTDTWEWDGAWRCVTGCGS